MAHYRSNSHIDHYIDKAKALIENQGKDNAFVFRYLPTHTRVDSRYCNSHKILQDIRWECLLHGKAGSQYSVEYTAGATAGAEVVSVVNKKISIQIEDGVSTAQQIIDAFDAFVVANPTSEAANLQAVLSGADVAQNIESEVNLILVDFESNAGADIFFVFDGSTFTVTKTDVKIVNRLRTKRYLADADAATIA